MVARSRDRRRSGGQDGQQGYRPAEPDAQGDECPAPPQSAGRFQGASPEGGNGTTTGAVRNAFYTEPASCGWRFGRLERRRPAGFVHCRRYRVAPFRGRQFARDYDCPWCFDSLRQDFAGGASAKNGRLPARDPSGWRGVGCHEATANRLPALSRQIIQLVLDAEQISFGERPSAHAKSYWLFVAAQL